MQILREIPFSGLHLFTPLGAGDAGAAPRRGGLPPQRGVSALPSPTAPTTLFRLHRACPHCGQMLVRFILLLPFALKSALWAALQISWQEPLSAMIAHKGPDAASHSLGGIRHPARRRGTQALPGAGMGLHGFEPWVWSGS